VTYDLSANRSWSFGTITGSGASGQVSYWDGTTSQAGSNDFQWNGTNLLLGNDKGLVLQTAGTNRNVLLRPTVILDNYAGLSMYPNSGTNVGFSLSIIPRGTGYNSQIKSQITVFNTDYTADSTNYELGVFRAAGDRFSFSTGAAGTGTNKPFLLSSGYADGATNPNHLWLYTSGNVGINTSSDGGQRLQVQGTTLLNGNVTFSSATGMFWDATNSRLGIGTNAPAYDLHILKASAANGEIGFQVRNTTTTGGAFSSFSNNLDERLVLEMFGSSWGGGGLASKGTLSSSGSNGLAHLVFSNSSTAHFSIHTTTSVTERFRLFGNTGNVLIQNGGTFTDSGERLQVTGTMKVTGASSFGGNMSLALNQNLDTYLSITNTTSGTSSQSYITLISDTNSGQFVFGKYSTAKTAYKTINSKDSYIYNNTVGGDISLLNDFASGNIKFAAGGSSTAHFTIKSNGRINMSSLPTSSTGLATGDLWNNAGVINIV
jgi:hypothetical protein